MDEKPHWYTNRYGKVSVYFVVLPVIVINLKITRPGEPERTLVNEHRTSGVATSLRYCIVDIAAIPGRRAHGHVGS